MEIHAGTVLTCTTAGGGEVTMCALGPVEQGIDFPVVWVCTLAEYARGGGKTDARSGIPWPLTALRVVEDQESYGWKASG
jgi:hypothetical protein